MAKDDDWTPLLEDLRRRRVAARGMGGADRLARQRTGSRLDARARVEELCDPGSFAEIGTLVGGVPRHGLPPVPADAFVAGHGLIEGRPVLVGAEDFTVKGGSIGLGTHAKRLRLARLAADERVPLVILLEGAGERVTNALERYPFAPNDLQAITALSGIVPTVAVVMGASAGHGALTAPLMDFVVLVKGASLFSAGPLLVKNATGEEVTKEELGGGVVHTEQSGVAHNLAGDDASALRLVRQYLGYFPTHAWSLPPRSDPGGDVGERSLDDLCGIVPANPRRSYDMHQVLHRLCDEGRFLEVQPDFGRSMLTVLCRLGGQSVAVVANQPNVKAGAIDRDAGDKAAHFLEVVGAFHLPVVFLADNPGVLAGPAAERAGVLRSASRMFAAQSRLRVPKLHVTLRKAYGFGSSIMAMNPFDHQTITLAFPAAHLAAMPAEGGGSAARADEETRQELAASEHGGPYGTADTMAFDEVIEPPELRNALLAGLRLASARETSVVGPVRSSGIRP